MIHWKLFPMALLALALAACGGDGDGESGGTQAGQERAAAPAGDTGREGPWEDTPDDPGEMAGKPGEESRELWAIIQEEQSELSGEHQRALQACAEIKLRDNDITMEDAVLECREEMEEMAEEQQEEDEDEGENDGNGGDG